jgi:hypothetical protein
MPAPADARATDAPDADLRHGTSAAEFCERLAHQANRTTGAAVLVADGSGDVAVWVADERPPHVVIRCVLSRSTTDARRKLSGMRLLGNVGGIRTLTGDLEGCMVTVAEDATGCSFWLFGTEDANWLTANTRSVAAALAQLAAVTAAVDDEARDWWRLLHDIEPRPALVRPTTHLRVVAAETADGLPGPLVLRVARRDFPMASGWAADADSRRVYVVMEEVMLRSWRPRASRLQLGLGPVVADPAQLRWARECADEALSIAATRDDDTPVWFDDEFGELVRRATARAVSAMRLPRDNPVQRLRDHDATHGTSLLTTLDRWLRCHRDNRVTADNLGIHLNTVRYRLQQIRRIVGGGLDDPDDALAITILTLIASDRPNDEIASRT